MGSFIYNIGSVLGDIGLISRTNIHKFENKLKRKSLHKSTDKSLEISILFVSVVMLHNHSIDELFFDPLFMIGFKLRLTIRCRPSLAPFFHRRWLDIYTVKLQVVPHTEPLENRAL